MTYTFKQVQLENNVFYLEREGLSGSLRYFLSLEEAKTQANEDANNTRQNKYVIKYNDIYVVCGYLKIWDWFGGQWKSVVYAKEQLR